MVHVLCTRTCTYSLEKDVHNRRYQSAQCTSTIRTCQTRSNFSLFLSEHRGQKLVSFLVVFEDWYIIVCTVLC